MRRLTRLTATFFLTAVATLAAQTPPPGPAEDGTLQALLKIAGTGAMRSRAFDYLTQLGDEVGPRVTGAPGMWKAVEWGIARMKAMGLENVRAERYPMWRGWTRGTAEMVMLTPRRVPLNVDAMGWTGSTAPGGADADLVMVNMNAIQEAAKTPERFRGKVILVVARGEEVGADAFLAFGGFLKAAAANGVVAVIGGQGGAPSAGMNLTHTGILGFSTDFEVPVVSITAEGQGLLERALDRGAAVRLHVNVQNSFTPGPVDAANVVGEIRGREHPEEVFVVGAHLDSWDLAEGTTDDGAGSAAVLSAAESIMLSAERPRRTIRFVLFTGEEQGLLGSFAYIKQHQPELANHLGNLVLDNGQGPVHGFSLGGRDDLLAAFRPFLASLGAFGNFRLSDAINFGVDAGPFSLSGLPGINMDNDSPEYGFTHHSAADALEAQRPDVLAKNAALMALTAFWIADRPERFATPWPAERTARKFMEAHEDVMLRAFGLWPFGDKR